jgi:hypothetical protein
MSWSATARKNWVSAAGVASLNVTLNSTVAGNLIAVATSGWKSTGPTSMAVSDGTNGAYTSAFFAVNGSPAIALHYLPNNAGGNLTVTATPGPASSYDMAIAVHEFSGGDTVAPASGTPATNTGISAADSTGTMTPSDNDVLLLAALDHDSYTAVTENAASEGFTLSNENEGAPGQPISLVYKIITGAPGTPSHSWSAGTSANWAAGIAAFKTPSSVVNVPSAIGWRNRQNPRLRGPIRQSRFQRTQLWSTAPAGSTVNGNGASASSFVTVGQLSGVGNLTGKSAMTIQSAGSGSGTGAMSGASSVTINTKAAGSGNGALTGASSVTINTRAAGSGKGALTGAGSVTINTSGAGSGKAALAGQSTFTISTGGTLTSSAIGSMIGRSVFGFAARVSGAGLANMTGNSGISESSAAAGSGKAAMTGRSTFSFAPQIFLQALTPISGRSQMNLVLRGLMTGLTPPKPSWLELPLSNAYRANEISSTPRDNRIESEYRDNRITTEGAK